MSEELTPNNIQSTNLITTMSQSTVESDSGQEPRDCEVLLEKGFMCYHCSIIFENKKVLRQHISKRHMDLENLGSEDDGCLNPTEVIENHQKKKKKEMKIRQQRKKEKRGSA